MRTRHAAIAAAALLALSACTTDSSTDAKASPSSSAPSVSAADLAKAREAAGLPPSPEPAPRAAYIDGLNAIDPDIVHGKDDKAVSRGINTCSSIKNFPGDGAKQIKLTGQRFSSPTHPEGRDTATAEKILDLAHKHICPDF
ncbi:hypothetical protein [Streptomyces sp. NBC_00827]|uniref:hypothetical protein n=1 Tax=Streptomyces sp. NBC_00827 TaxID=2903677 RepID=UPI00386C9257|nr:hypothetical protein OG569_02215 [Streptomyces sp. NBC_00827]